MLINGLEVRNKDITEILPLVKSLPSGFSQRMARRTDDTAYRESEAHTLANQGSDLFADWQQTRSPEKLAEAFELYKAAVASAKVGDDPLTKAISLARYALVAMHVKGMSETLMAQTDAMLLARDIGAMDFASQYAGELHRSLVFILKEGTRNGALSDEQKQTYTKILQNIRPQAAQLGRRQHGEPVDEQAYRVEQAEVGFSNRQKIGTDFLAQCISPVLWNPKTKMTALAHVDQSVDEESLLLAMNRLNYSHKGPPLLLRLVGGNHEIDDGGHLTHMFTALALNNVSRVISFFRDKNVDVISADILNKSQPSSVVVDPATFTLAEAIPGINNPDFFVANAKANTRETMTAVHIAFDLSRSEKRAPVFIDSAVATKLSILREWNVLDIYDQLKELDPDMGCKTAERAESSLSIIEAHVVAISDIINEIAFNLEDKGIKFTKDEYMQLAQLLSFTPMCLGENACEANTVIRSDLEKSLTKIAKGDRKPISFERLSGLYGTDQPYMLLKP